MSQVFPSDNVVQESSSTKVSLSYHEIANKLISDKLLLTALELHTELLESGRELKQLKDFFSNPGNFELSTHDWAPRISRSGSQVTLDSLDLTRFSEDGGGTDERVAVLEFELRKAKETINALRNNLTVATESETSTPDKGSLRNISVGVIKPHEQRALNYLINEYLLLYGYKLTSITFADENESQDFDDWDDVGLNISRPPELLTVYREGLKQTGQNCTSICTQTDCIPEISGTKEQENIQEMVMEVEELKLQLEELNTALKKLESENLELTKSNNVLLKENDRLSSQKNEIALATTLSAKNSPTSKESFGSDSPERFELIDKDGAVFKKCDSVAMLEDNISNNSFNASDWTKLTLNTTENAVNSSFKENQMAQGHQPKISDLLEKDPFRNEVFSLCYTNIPQKIDNELLENILNNSVTLETLIHTLSICLSNIIPNIILNKREEAIPLLIVAVCLNRNSAERDKLLQQLFNLKKKPSDSERSMILGGLVDIAKCSGEITVESEILPQCWEQLSHKHVERRLLVAEACITLIPYTSSHIRNSLILSMIQQMIEDKEDVVRETVIRALSLLISLCEETDKYDQCEELVFSTLNDSSTSVVNLSTELLFPVLGKWALEIGRLRTNLFKRLLLKLNTFLKDTESPNKFNQNPDRILRIICILENLLSFLLMSVACHDDILSNVEKDMERPLRPDLVKLCTNLTNPVYFFKSDKNTGVILFEFDKFVVDNPDKSWKEVDWILDMMIPDLLNNLNHVEANQHILLKGFINLFSHICKVFGKNFTKLKIYPLLKSQIQNLEQILTSFNQYCPSLNIIPVYLVAVLSGCDTDELLNVLKRFVCSLPLCGSPLDCLEVTVKGLCECGLQEIVVASLWEAVVHQRPLVRAAAATLFSDIVGLCDAGLLISKVTPALVTLANDNDVLVRTATIPALGSLITDCDVKEIHDKVYMQIQTYICDNNLRENHSLLRQIIVTLGNVVNSCTPQFREDIILPQLTSLSNYMLQMSNQTRKIDMALALVEAFANIVYSPVNRQTCSSSLLLGLRCLESVVTENQSLLLHQEAVLAMIRECDNKIENQTSQSSNLDHRSSSGTNKISQNVNQGVEEMRQRVSKMFNKPVVGGSKPNSLPNIQNIFKKK